MKRKPKSPRDVILPPPSKFERQRYLRELAQELEHYLADVLGGRPDFTYSVDNDAGEHAVELDAGDRGLMVVLGDDPEGRPYRARVTLVPW